ncbi:calcium-binding protein P isoform X2 [Drosophila persimilis]|uniref:calcium-binding protein P isoform X2 n=1 Tax=Drosophila persimilis TaxID=7234 RepID=UPI000F079F97|nr:calcium-binding protein P isoform X2 [Drosophila persimilis]
MAWRSGIAFAALTVALILTVGSQASQFSRDESREEEETNFNLASTLTGGIRSSRHHQRANLNSHLYPDSVQPGTTYAGPGIDDPHGHEQGGTSSRAGDSNLIGYVGSQSPPLPAAHPGQELPPGIYPPPGYPTTGPPQPPVHFPTGNAAHQSGGAAAPGPYYTQPRAGSYPQPGVGSFPQPGAGSYPQPGVGSFPQPGVPSYPQPGVGSFPQPAAPGAYPAGYPSYAYPGVYLPQFPGYLQPGAYPGYAPGAPPVIVHPGAAPPAGAGATAPSYPQKSSRHHSRYPTHDAQDPEHWDHRFSMNTEYNEDGVHKGSFDVLNNHNAFGYGSGYGGGYNGAFNSPAF